MESGRVNLLSTFHIVFPSFKTQSTPFPTILLLLQLMLLHCLFWTNLIHYIVVLFFVFKFILNSDRQIFCYLWITHIHSRWAYRTSFLRFFKNKTKTVRRRRNHGWQVWIMKIYCKWEYGQFTTPNVILFGCLVLSLSFENIAWMELGRKVIGDC